MSGLEKMETLCLQLPLRVCIHPLFEVERLAIGDLPEAGGLGERLQVVLPLFERAEGQPLPGVADVQIVAGLRAILPHTSRPGSQYHPIADAPLSTTASGPAVRDVD